MTQEIIIKSVFCSYRGILIVYDIHGSRVNHLCGELTLEKYEEIEKRRTDITEFDGLEHYKRIVSEKEGEAERKSQQLPPPFSNNIGQTGQVAVSEFTIENTSKKTLPVVLFGAYQSASATNFGFTNGIIIDKPKEYGQFLAQSMAQPFIIKQLIIQNVDKICSVIGINKKTSMGATITNNLNINAGHNPFGVQQNVAQYQLNNTLDGATDFSFDLAGNSKVHIKLFH